MTNTRKTPAEQQKDRWERAARGEMPASVRHGASAARNWGCKCEICVRGVAESNAQYAKKKKGAPAPPKSSPYRVLAATCRRCGTLRTTPDHLIRKTANEKHFPQCSTCNRRINDAWDRANPEKRREIRRRARMDNPRTHSKQVLRTKKRLQSKTLTTAERWGYTWTTREIDLAADADLSTQEVARLTGRTYYAVQSRRKQMRRDQEQEVTG